MSADLGGTRIAKLERIGNSNAFEFEFDPSLLDRLASVYDNHVARNSTFKRFAPTGRSAYTARN